MPSDSLRSSGRNLRFPAAREALNAAVKGPPRAKTLSVSPSKMCSKFSPATVRTYRFVGSVLWVSHRFYAFIISLICLVAMPMGRSSGTPVQASKRGEQVALVALGVRQEAAGLDRAAALAGDDEGQVFAGVLVAVLKSGAPHHDAVVEQGAVAFAQAGHLFHHVGELGDVEGGDRGDFADFRARCCDGSAEWCSFLKPSSG